MYPEKNRMLLKHYTARIGRRRGGGEKGGRGGRGGRGERGGRGGGGDFISFFHSLHCNTHLKLHSLEQKIRL